MSGKVKLVVCNEPQNCETVKEFEARLSEAEKILKYFKDLLIDAYPCLGSCLGDYCEDFVPTNCPAVQAKLYWDKHKALLRGEAE
jgi:hypothetical protein